MSFSHIKGQEQVINQLRRSINKGQITHAYLFTGPDGVGKRTTALALAEGLNCRHPLEGEGCGNCLSCKKFLTGNHPDIKLIEPEGNSIKIDQVRAIRKQVYYISYESKYKVIIFDEAHLLTLQGANSLLKVLEEPPQNTIFILVTSQPQQLPDTIISRCQEIKFLPLSTSLIKEILGDIYPDLKEQGEVYARLARGSLGRATRLVQEESLKEKREATLNFLSNLQDSSLGKIALWCNIWERDRQGVRLALEMIQFWYRDLLIWKITEEEDLVINKDFLNNIKSDSYSLEVVQEALALVQDSLRKIELNVNPQLVLEVLLMKINLKGGAA